LRPETAGHVRELRPLLSDRDLQRRLSEALPIKVLCAWIEGCAFFPLLVASVSHHGTPWNTREERRCAHLWRAGGDGYDPFAALAEIGGRLPAWFPAAFETGGPLIPDNAQFQHAFAGLVMLADWLGSHRAFFPFSNGHDPERMTFARRAAGEALASVGLAVRDRRARLQAASPSFEHVFPFKPNPMQASTGGSSDSRLAILEAETGSGKTEAALWRFKQLFEQGRVDGLYFALPTRIAATQIHRRVQQAVARLWPDERQRPGVLLAVPGYVKIDEARVERILPGFEVLWSDDPSEAKAHERWAGENSKRFLAAQIAVGAIDQALLANLQVRHAHLRSAALLRHLLVVDEVHASDAYMTALLRSVLAVHLQVGGHALLMSATLGSAARTAYLAGNDAPPDLGQAIGFPYPCLSLAHGGAVRHVPLAGAERPKRVCLQPRAVLEDAPALAEAALAAARAGATVLVVRNTVGGAVAAQEALEARLAADGDRQEDHALLFRCEGTITLHHGRFAREDRKLLDQAVEARLGRDRTAGGAIVIGTQTLEQSLDIDADLLITDLCPMDVLLQRIGRLHRHARPDRPDGFETPVCIVAVPGARDLTPLLRRARHGLGIVYPDVRIIEATWRLIAAHPEIEIPAMNRELVERSTHPGALARIEGELGEAWVAASRKLAGETAAKTGVARLHGIDRTQAFGGFAFAGIDEVVRTRLGANDRLVDWQAAGVEPPTGPFGQRVQMLTIPGFLCNGLPADAAPAPLEPDGGGFAFRFGDKRFRYGRFGLAAIKEIERC
jgi:CRISPR-associated endonuclease/helicase Cas3